jgi:hypothetical protein
MAGTTFRCLPLTFAFCDVRFDLFSRFRTTKRHYHCPRARATIPSRRSRTALQLRSYGRAGVFLRRQRDVLI